MLEDTIGPKFRRRLIVLHFSNTNTTGVVTSVKSHLELHREVHKKLGDEAVLGSLRW